MAQINLRSNQEIIKNLEAEKNKPIEYNLLKREETKSSTSTSFMIKPNRRSLVDENPLNSSEALQQIKEQTDPETPPEKISLFDLKGNSKARENQFVPPKFEFKPFQPKKQEGNKKEEDAKPNPFAVSGGKSIFGKFSNTTSNVFTFGGKKAEDV